ANSVALLKQVFYFTYKDPACINTFLVTCLYLSVIQVCCSKTKICSLVGIVIEIICAMVDVAVIYSMTVIEKRKKMTFFSHSCQVIKGCNLYSVENVKGELYSSLHF